MKPSNRNDTIDAIRQEINDLALRRSIKVTCEQLNADPPAACDKKIIDAVENACGHLELPWWKMISRAYHDTLFMSRLAPTGMIFIPCRGGVSHRPEEYASPADIAVGVEVLAHTLAELSVAE